jgi:hypothetical protein
MLLLTTLAMAATLSVPSRTSANVSLAAQGRVVVAVWAASTAGGQSDVFAAVSKDAGTTFGAPVRVNSTEGDARTNGEQPPHVVLVRSTGAVPEIVVVWTTKGQSGTTLLTSRSKDGGRTFSRSAIVPGSDAPGARGWEDATSGSSGAVHAVWLDHRAMAPPPGTPAGTHVHGAGAADGYAMAQRSSVYTSILGQPDSIREVAKGVCFCCKTAIVTGADGTVYAAWRNVYPGSIRDIATSVSHDGGRTFSDPVKVSDDRWELNACPDDGPAMATDRASRLHIVWPTLVTDSKGAPSLALFYATSSDGRTFSPRQRLPTEGVPHHPQIAVDSSGAATIAWDETGRGPRQVVVATVPAGRGTPRISRTGTLGEGTYPVLAGTSEGVAVAWTAGPEGQGVVQVQRLPIR